MTLELATRTVAYSAGIVKDVFIQLGKLTFLTDFVVVDYDADPRIPLILGTPFLRMAHALVNVHGEELTLRVGDEKLVFNIESTSKYPRKHGDESIHKIDILDITCEDHFHEVLNVQKSINPMSGSPTPFFNHVVAFLSHSLTPFRDSDFILEEINAFLTSDDLISPDIDDRIFDPEGDIYPLDLELKDLPPQLAYAFLEGTSKLPVIIAKDLKSEEKEQLLNVLMSHKQAIAWKIYDIRGIDHNFCTHKILMEDDFKPAVQHQRRVNPKIHEVIKAEAIKLLDAGLIYPSSDSPWEKTTFTCPYGTFAYRRMPFGLCNAPGLSKDRAKVEGIVKLPPLTKIKGIRSFLGHVGFYRRFIQDFSKIAWSMTHLLEKDTPFFLSSECQSSFEILKKKLTEAPIVSLDWDLPFKIMYDASDFAVGAVLRQRKE
nr:reverse transcriptase domain-containing protein [Tanacetum cinerariifolium]